MFGSGFQARGFERLQRSGETGRGFVDVTVAAGLSCRCHQPGRFGVIGKTAAQQRIEVVIQGRLGEIIQSANFSGIDLISFQNAKWVTPRILSLLPMP